KRKLKIKEKSVADVIQHSCHYIVLGEKEMKEEQLRNLCVAGIGASAGGVEALQTVFQKMPSNAGIAYIVVQHLSPDYKSYMQSLLERCTDMPIIHAENEMEVEPNTV